MSSYQKEVQVRFGHCDPATFVYYPRYFEMLNGFIEDWFEEGLEALRVRDEASPGGGQPGTRAAALKQRDTQRLFQPPHPLGDVGLNGIEGACGAAHAAQTGDRGEGGEISTFHRIRISDG